MSQVQGARDEEQGSLDEGVAAESREHESDATETSRNQARVSIVFFGKIIHSCCSFLIAIALLCAIVPTTMLQHPSGFYYLGSAGICALVWGVMVLASGLESLAIPAAWIDAPKDDTFATAEETLRETFPKTPAGTRVCECIFILARGLANPVVLAYGYLTLPARNPYEALNFFRYCLAWFEMPIALVLIILTIFKGMNWACCARGRALSTFARQLYRSGRFSALSFLHMASPPKMLKTVLAARRRIILLVAKQKEPASISRTADQSRSTLMLKKELNNWETFNLLLRTVVVGLAMPMVYVTAAVGAVLVKISQVSFVATKQVNEWTMLEYIQFLSFVNALTGLGEDTNILVQQKLVWERYSEDLDRDISEELLLGWWRTRLCDDLQREFGWFRGAIFAITLNQDDVSRLRLRAGRKETE